MKPWQIPASVSLKDRKARFIPASVCRQGTLIYDLFPSSERDFFMKNRMKRMFCTMPFLVTALYNKEGHKERA